MNSNDAQKQPANPISDDEAAYRELRRKMEVNPGAMRGDEFSLWLELKHQAAEQGWINRYETSEVSLDVLEKLRKEVADAEAHLATLMDRWDRYDGNNPNKYRTDIKLAKARVDTARAALRAKEQQQ